MRFAVAFLAVDKSQTNTKILSVKRSTSALQMFDFRNLQNGIQDQLNFNLQLQNINMSTMKLF